MLTLVLSLLLVPSLLDARSEDLRPDAVLLRQPDVSTKDVVFRYYGDLWLVPKEGGVARRITHAPGAESFPKFSPDETRLAFMASYDGGSELYVIDLAAGVPERLTHHPAHEVLSDWTPDGAKLIFWSTEVSGTERAARVLTVAVEGGQPEAIAVPYGTFAALDASGSWLAYTPASLEGRTWNRYQGGWAQDVWLFNVRNHEFRSATDWPGNDGLPMWHGRELVFLSDRQESGRSNLFLYDLDSGKTRGLTDFRDTDVRFPSIGPEDVVFEAGGKLWRYEFASGQRVEIDVVIPGDRPALREATHDLVALAANESLSPKAKRVLIEARGELFDLPVEKGVTRNLCDTDGVAEREPGWSPDGAWIAYVSDRTGEYEITVRTPDGGGERSLTSIGPGWKSNLVWAPDSSRIAFAMNDGSLWIVALDGTAPVLVTRAPEGDPITAAWSPDSAWLAFAHRHSVTKLGAIHLYELASSALHEVTSGKFDDLEPVFDGGGDWLYYLSARSFEPSYDDYGLTWIYANSRQIVAVPLRGDVENPFGPKDERDGDAEGEDEGSADEAGDADAADAPPEPVHIELAGFEARALLLPVPPGQLSALAAGQERVVYVRGSRTGAEEDDAELEFFDLDAEEATEVLGGVDGFELDRAGKHALVRKGDELGLVELEEEASFEPIDLSGLVATIEPRAEWKQLLDDVYRIYRDFFYEPTLHGVDWKSVHARYVTALVDATSREDVHAFIGAMISELNVGHAYNDEPAGGLHEESPAQPVGLLGCDWVVDQGAFRIARILGSEAPYDLDARSPLAAQGIDVRVGDYLLTVNGRAVDARGHDVYEFFGGSAGRATEIIVNDEPARGPNERRAVVEPLESESALRYRDWVARKRAKVAALSAGRVGYVHVPDTGLDGQTELFRQFLGEMHADALLVDERFNSGGQIPDRFIELLDRPVRNYWALRHGEDWGWPIIGHSGPKAMLINGWSGSGGDCFPYYFRQSQLGPLVGRRTWGGLVGLSGNPGLIDGANPNVPRFAFYELDGTWGVEGYGVAPDVDVLDDPSKMLNEGDPQLEKAVELLLADLDAHPPLRPVRPASPDRSGVGVTPEDR